MRRRSVCAIFISEAAQATIGWRSVYDAATGQGAFELLSAALSIAGADYTAEESQRLTGLTAATISQRIFCENPGRPYKYRRRISRLLRVASIIRALIVGEKSPGISR